MAERDLLEEAIALEKHWSKSVEFRGPGYENYSGERRRYMAEAVASFKPKSVLEVGCFGGYNLREIHKIDPSISLTGYDTNLEALNYLNQKAPYVRTIQGSIYELGKVFAESKFDVVFTSGVLIHIPCFDKKSNTVDSRLIEGIIQDIAGLATKGIVHGEHNGDSFAKVPEKGMRYIHNFKEMYTGVKKITVEDAIEPGGGFEHLIKVSL